MRTSWADFEIKRFLRVEWNKMKLGMAQIMATGDAEKLKAVVVYEAGSTDPYVIIRGSEFLRWTGADLREKTE